LANFDVDLPSDNSRIVGYPEVILNGVLGKDLGTVSQELSFFREDRQKLHEIRHTRRPGRPPRVHRLLPGVAVRLSCTRADGFYSAQSCLQADRPDRVVSGPDLVVAHPQDARLLLSYGNALSGVKQYKEARAQFDRAKTIGGLGQRDLGLPAAKACALDHDPEAAMAWLKTIPPQFLPASIQSDPDFVSLKDRDDFQALFHTH